MFFQKSFLGQITAHINFFEEFLIKPKKFGYQTKMIQLLARNIFAMYNLSSYPIKLSNENFYLNSVFTNNSRNTVTYTRSLSEAHKNFIEI